ncbi:hypothetical protein TWF506_005314 [Arthrobotrys conoides]|uniref:F-box domain-containing protein n=1 Tax=Arthrobotrys conoides TaxID=74498 RepID=A0AAN8NJ13_9PEZI
MFSSILRWYRASSRGSFAWDNPPVKPSKPPKPVPYILRMPVEISLQIFSYLPDDIKTQLTLSATCNAWCLIILETPAFKRNRYEYPGGASINKSSSHLGAAAANKHLILKNGIYVTVHDYVIRRYLLDTEWGSLDIPFINEPFFSLRAETTYRNSVHEFGTDMIAPNETAVPYGLADTVVFRVKIRKNTTQKVCQGEWTYVNLGENATIGQYIQELVLKVKETAEKFGEAPAGRVELSLQVSEARDTSMDPLRRRIRDPNTMSPLGWFVDVLAVLQPDITEGFLDLSIPPPVLKTMHDCLF